MVLRTVTHASCVAATDWHVHTARTVLQVSPKMRVEELRNVIRDAGGILPALQRLSYAGEAAGWLSHMPCLMSIQ